MAQHNPELILKRVAIYRKLVNENYKLFKQIKKSKSKQEVRLLLLSLNKLFQETICYYLFFVFLGYAGHLLAIKRFFKEAE